MKDLKTIHLTFTEESLLKFKDKCKYSNVLPDWQVEKLKVGTNRLNVNNYQKETLEAINYFQTKEEEKENIIPKINIKCLNFDESLYIEHQKVILKAFNCYSEYSNEIESIFLYLPQDFYCFNDGFIKCNDPVRQYNVGLYQRKNSAGFVYSLMQEIPNYYQYDSLKCIHIHNIKHQDELGYETIQYGDIITDKFHLNIVNDDLLVYQIFSEVFEPDTNFKNKFICAWCKTREVEPEVPVKIEEEFINIIL